MSEPIAASAENIERMLRIWSAVERRAEQADGAGTLATYVDSDDFNPIHDPSSMVVFGRRGAGRTHTLLHLARKVRTQGDAAVFIDMRKLSSNAGIYEDTDVEFGTRATNILVDVANAIHDE